VEIECDGNAHSFNLHPEEIPVVNTTECRARFSAARSARLATVSAVGVPHLVPITFAVLEGDIVAFAVDHKPKRTVALQRLANIAANPCVAVLVDAYSEEWSSLWWVRADGVASVVEASSATASDALAGLAARYPQYVTQRPAGPVVLIQVERWTGWEASA
jgi:PPOX class probable F420-dependent enzyme